MELFFDRMQFENKMISMNERINPSGFISQDYI